jgi:putative transposase
VIEAALTRLLALETRADEAGEPRPWLIPFTEAARGLMDDFRAAVRGWEDGAEALQVTGPWLNNRAENSHQPFRRRERAMLRFRRMHSLQKFASAHASVHNHFNSARALAGRQAYKLNRAAALAEWRRLCAA